MNPHDTFCNTRRGGCICDCRVEWSGARCTMTDEGEGGSLADWERALLEGRSIEQMLTDLRNTAQALRDAGHEVSLTVTEKKIHRL